MKNILDLQSLTPDSVELRMTCGACPEQYDAFINGEEIGYLRLRHGCFRVEYRGDTVYTAAPNGDGMFESNERHGYLLAAKQVLFACYVLEHVKGTEGTWTP